MSKVVIRAFQKDDAGFIFSTWSKGAYHGAETKPQIEKSKWFRDHYLYVCDAIEQGDVRVACLADDSNTILGYSVAFGGSLQWIYVKQDFRRLGIGSMLERFWERVSNVHMTKIGKAILNKREEKKRGKETASIGDTSKPDGDTTEESKVREAGH